MHCIIVLLIYIIQLRLAIYSGWSTLESMLVMYDHVMTVVQKKYFFQSVYHLEMILTHLFM